MAHRIVRAGARDMSRFSVLACLLAVILLSSLNLLRNLDEPRGAIWDESYYLASTQRYLEGKAQFASHPPLGLMLIAAGKALSGQATPADHELGSRKRVDGRDIPAGFDFAGARIASAVFGIGGAAIFFLLMLQLTGRREAALLFSFPFLFDTALIAHLRAAHLDAFQLFFALCALLCLARAVMRQDGSNVRLHLAFGLFCGLAAMVRLNGLALLPMGAMLGLARFRLHGDRAISRSAARLVKDAAAMTSGCVAALFLVFAAHILVSRNPPDLTTEAGRQDAAFLSPAHKAWLTRETPFSPVVLATGVADYRRFIAADFGHMAKMDMNGSTPLQWLAAQRPITYRWDSDGRRTAYVVLAPNLAVWWASLAAVMLAAGLIATALPSRRPWPAKRRLMAIFLGGWLSFMTLNLWLAGERVMYLYHYFPGLLLALAIAPLAVQDACGRWPAFARHWPRAGAGLLLSILALFFFLSPLALHKPLDGKSCALRNFAGTLVDCKE